MNLKRLAVVAAVLLLGGILTKILLFVEPKGWSSITPEQLQQMLESGEELVIVDVREKNLYDENHVPGAIWIPYSSVRDRMKELNTDDTIVFVCHSGPMGAASAQLLADNGYKSVYNLEGGMAAWKSQVRSDP